ncbi:MAG TPA: DUF433 domain-containing protein, partial [Hyphomicrobiaceae bacterium]
AISSHTDRASRARRLERAEALVLSDPEVMCGEPCIKGTRVPVYLIGALANPHGTTETRAMYPFLTEEQIELAALYVTEHPDTRRPRRIRFPKGTTTIRGFSKKMRL